MKRTLCILLSLMLALTGLAALCVTANAAYKTGDVIEYGCYPQTREEPTIKMKEVAQKAQWTSYGYCSGTGEYDGTIDRSDFMKYADFDYNGNRYRAVCFTQYRPDSTIKPFAGYNSYQDNNGYETGEIYCFKYEPLKWRVLDPDAGLILCESIIDAQEYKTFVKKTGSDYYGSNNNDYYANNYYNSSISGWLYYDFYDVAFNAAQKENIKVTSFEETCNDPSQEQFMHTNSEYVFLLSYEDVLNTSYGFAASESATDGQRRAYGTDYAKCQGLAHYYNYNGTSFWWLRTCGVASHFACWATFSGCVEDSGTVEYTCIGVRPACCLNELKNDGAQIGGVNAVSVAFDDITLDYKSSATLHPRITADEGAAYTLKYASSDANVVTVDENGNLYAARRGTAEITITAVDKYGREVTDTCKVTVKYTFPQWLIVIFLFGWIWY